MDRRVEKPLNNVVEGSFVSLRVRGAIRSREVERPGFIPSGGQQDVRLDELIRDLKKQVDSLPLGMICHGWGSQSTEQFYNLLYPLLSGEDALWLIPDPQTAPVSVPPEVRRVAVLDLNRDIGFHIYQTLAHDLVYFPAEQEKEVGLVSAFESRARAVVVDARGFYAEKVLNAGCEARLMIYSWTGEGILSSYAGCWGLRQLPVLEDYSDYSVLDPVGKELKAVADYFENHANRRVEFRKLIDKLDSEYQTQAKWKEYLFRQADKFNWASWAIECLDVYVPIEVLPDGQTRSLICHYLYNCLTLPEERRVLASLCKGKVLEVLLPTISAHFIASRAAPIFERNLRENLSSDRAFAGALIQAMVEIEQDMDDEDLIDLNRDVRQEVRWLALTTIA